MIDLKEPSVDDYTTMTEEEDGSLILEVEDKDDWKDLLIEIEHEKDLSISIPEDEQLKIVQDVISSYEEDLRTRSSWDNKTKKGRQIFGVVDEASKPRFEGDSIAVHPGLSIATWNFWSRVITEMWPSIGPVSCIAHPQAAPDVQDKAETQREFFNYALTSGIVPDAFEEDVRLFLQYPLYGVAIKKIFIDSKDRARTVTINPVNFIINNKFTSLETAHRYTERIDKYENELKRDIEAGLYANVEYNKPQIKGDEIEDAINEATNTDEEVVNDAPFTILEQYVELDLGEAPYPVPYIVSVLKDEGVLLSVYRNWEENDPKYNKLTYHVDYRTPGEGFWSPGLYGMASGLTDTETDILRRAITTVAMGTSTGGYLPAEAKDLERDKKGPFGVGEWRQTKVTADILSRAFYPLPTKELSPAVVQLLGYMDSLSNRLFSTTDVPMGEVKSDMPIGTATIMTEQANRVPNALMLLIFKARNREYRILQRIFRKLIDEDYNYSIDGLEKTISPGTFDSNLLIVPVSSPAFSNAQARITMGQTLYQMASNPMSGLDFNKVEMEVLKLMRFPGWQNLLKDPNAGPTRQEQLADAGAEAEVEKAKADAQISQAKVQDITDKRGERINRMELKNESHQAGMMQKMQGLDVSQINTQLMQEDAMLSKAQKQTQLAQQMGDLLSGPDKE